MITQWNSLPKEIAEIILVDIQGQIGWGSEKLGLAVGVPAHYRRVCLDGC